MDNQNNIGRVLASLDEYFELKRDSQGAEGLDLEGAKERAAKTLNEYIQLRFDELLTEDKKRTSSITQKVNIPDASKTKFTWEAVAGLLDALNSPPAPSLSPDFRWLEAYRNWYKDKRTKAINSISPIDLSLDLEWEELK